MAITPTNMRPVLTAAQMAALKGSKGDTGSAGVAGTNGSNGLDGKNGSNGLDGKNGNDGAKGDTGLKGDAGVKGDTGPAGSLNVSTSPVSRAIAIGSAYQATNPAKASVLYLTVTSTSSISLSGSSNSAAAVVIGPTAAVATGTGTVAAQYENALSGALVVGLTLANKATQTYTVILPAGWYFAIRQTVGTGLSILSAVETQLT